MKSYLCRLVLLTLGAAALPAVAADTGWPQWRGPNHNGTSDARNLPTEFGTDKNVLWAAKLPGGSNNTPVVAGGKIFLSAINPSRNMICLAVDQATGKVLWEQNIGVAQIMPKGENDVASPSPVTDGKTVVYLFGTGDIAAFDTDGKKLWARNLQKEVGKWNVNWIYGSSPTLHKGKLYVPVLHTDKPYGNTDLPGGREYPDNDVPSYILALDPATGKDLWRVNRPTDAVKETKESYATLIPHTTAAGREELLMVGGSAVTGHDPETGKELWRYSGWDPNHEPYWRLIPSVVVGKGIILACAPKNGPITAIKEGGTGDVSATHQAWITNGKEITSDVPVPLFYKDHFFILDHQGTKLTKVEPLTGKAVWSTKLETDSGKKTYARASPTGADNKIYCMNADGQVWVVSPDDGKVVSKTNLGGNKNARGTVVAIEGMLLIRVGDTLYAFGNAK